MVPSQMGFHRLSPTNRPPKVRRCGAEELAAGAVAAGHEV